MVNVSRFLLSTNAKDIGILYFIFSITSGFLGISYSILMRLKIILSINNSENLYNTLITFHGLIMIFYFVMPYMIGGMGNYFIPILVGTYDMAFPRLNNFSYFLMIPSLILLLLSSLMEVGTGWTMYDHMPGLIWVWVLFVI